MSMKALLALLLIACAPTYTFKCVSKCGIHVIDHLNTEHDEASPPDGKGTVDQFCAGLPDYETKMLEALTDSRVVAADPRFKNACKAMNGWRVHVMDRDEWDFYPDSSGVPETVYGLTYCDMGYTMVDNAGTTLAHEMAHAVQRCQPVPPVDPDNPDHSNWGPIYDSLRRHRLRE